MERKTRTEAATGFRTGLAKYGWTAARGCVTLALCVISSAALPAHSRIAPAASQAGAPSSRLVTDELGRRLEVPTEVRRIVSLAPNLTEIVFALGEGDRLAGDTQFCDYPPEAREKPHVGGPVNPNLEKIVSLAPDVVLASKSINRRDTVEALARIGVPVYVTDPRSLDGMLASVEHLGALLNAEKTAVPLVQQLRARLAELDRRLAGTPPRRVLFVVWIDPLITVGRGTFLADGLRRAGARSVVDAEAEWPRISLEEMVRLQPEFLVFASARPEEVKRTIETLRTRPGWRDLNALRRGNVVVVSDAINRPAPRMVDAIEQLARALHSELFAPGDTRSGGAAQFDEEACACAR
jgi:iron complex transport system substrate-binding protein